MAVDQVDVFFERIIGLKLQPFHKRWLDFQIGNPKSLILGPRGFAKTTVCNVGYCLWNLIRNPNLRIMIVSNTASQAEGFLSEIKQHIENNPRFKEVFPDFKIGDRWTNTEVTLVNKTSITKEPNIVACGVNGPVISKHVDFLILDDIVNDANSRTEDQRRLLDRWFYQTLMPVMEPTGKIHILGTRYHFHDLYGQLQSREYSDTSIVDQAIQEDGTSLWEERFSIEALNKMKNAFGAIHFGMQ